MKFRYLFMLIFLMACKSKNDVGYDYIKKGEHEGIGEKYINERDDFSLNLKFPLKIGTTPEKERVDYFKLPYTDDFRSNQFYWEFSNRYFVLSSIYENKTIEEVISIAKEEIENNYLESELSILEYDNIPNPNQYIQGYLSNKSYSIWDFCFQTSTNRVLRMTMVGILPHKPLKYLEIDCKEIIAPLFENEVPKLNIAEVYVKNNFDPLKTMHIIQENKINDQLEAQAHIYNCIGEYELAQKAIYQNHKQNKEVYNYNERIVLRDFNKMTDTLIDAKTYLIQQLKEKNILLINENHSASQCRYFLSSLLDSLYDLGFKNIACEGISGIDQNGYREILDVKKGLGFYSNESEYGNILRQVLKRKGRVFGYSPPINSISSIKNRIRREGIRDSIMFQNIKTIYDSCLNRKEKLIVFVGHAHLLKMSDNGVKRLGNYMNKMYSKELLVVDQSYIFEQHLEVDSIPDIVKNLEFVSVLKRGSTDYIPKYQENQIDLFLIHPLLKNTLLYNSKDAFSKFKRIPSKNIEYAAVYDNVELKKYGLKKAIPVKVFNLRVNSFNPIDSFNIRQQSLIFFDKTGQEIKEQ